MTSVAAQDVPAVTPFRVEAYFGRIEAAVKLTNIMKIRNDRPGP
jgi:hypothetical protein